jgi:uncharacterized spore protein YtfJ
VELEDIFQAFEEMRDKASVSAIYGDPMEVGEKTIIPVADIKYGFGLGYGEGPARSGGDEEMPASGQSGGAGGGVAARPVAILEITADSINVKPVMDEGRIALVGILTGAWFIYWMAKTLKVIFGKK